MCGIFGVVGQPDAMETIARGLARMAYRGYDSSGIVTLDKNGFHRNRATGKIDALLSLNDACPLPGRTGIGHTRWATHGAPTEENAHPHIRGSVAIVHNGIIENHAALRDELSSAGFEAESSTDSEVIAMLLQSRMAAGDTPFAAMRHTLQRLEGAYAFGAIFQGHEDKLFVARKGSPLAIGIGEGANYIGSDAISLAPLTRQICYLQEGDMAVVMPNTIETFDAAGKPAERAVREVHVEEGGAGKNGFSHYMAKEMHEQPEAVRCTLLSQIDAGTGRITGAIGQIDFSNTRRVILIACGTSHYACMIAKYWIEEMSGIPAEVDIASEARYRSTPLCKEDTAIFVSQSGETADTLAALTHMKSRGARIVSLVNVPESSIARESDIVLPLLAGPEIGVASTKAFTCQLALLAILSLKAGLDRSPERLAELQSLLASLLTLPDLLAGTLEESPTIQDIARRISIAQSAFFLGRGTLFPVALEGALKLKEISYIHAEGYASGELKHGPIALIDDTTPTIVLSCPGTELHEKTLSNAQEVAARGGPVILFAVDPAASRPGDGGQALPAGANSLLSPFLGAVTVQLLAYHAACALWRDVDQPRNLAKAVTVE